MATTKIEYVTKTMASESTSTSLPDVEMSDVLEMSLEFGPPRQVPGCPPSPESTEEDMVQPKIKLSGLPSFWLGPPSLAAGLSRAACFGLPKQSSTTTNSARMARSTINKSHGSEKTSLLPGRRQNSITGRGKKRALDTGDEEYKPVKAAKIAPKNTKKATSRANRKATQKAIKTLSDFSIE
ncbi:hypothetical protein ONS95_007426 [Cadophora gregata]|uniref:uncharacterized protein n=1 Tax=Cadophora gregata TaxID=51156 RepID=UPI0026DC18D2|nr:uncharacterized protein ONS95_007426 [Cadophora gregata]KAK0118538.1 hypothetical protein ONS96_011632 [Cadophora gregata f. sp. sojae]KAK0125794.1 hypothetical protein ONS95_007426 [Cadophora gregata]